jgi:hypothetical protein
MDLSIGRKAALGLKLGLMAGVALGFGRLVWFLISENYQLTEIRSTLFNLAANSVNTFTFWAMLISIAFIAVWIFYPRLEGLCLAGLISAIVFLPIVYCVNKNYLPGVREIKSLVGNGMMGATALAFTFLIFRWMRNARFLHRFARTSIFITALVLLVAINVAFRLQPIHQRLQPAPTDPRKLMALFDLKAIASDHTNGGEAVTSASFQNYFARKFAARQPELRKRIAQLDSAKIIAHADSILSRRFTFVGVSKTLPEKIQWRNNPTKDFVWLFNLNRQEWLWDLAAAYFLTGDETYARDFELILSDWFPQNPMMKWKNESDPVWRLIDSSLRLTASWLDALTVFFPGDAISDDLKWKMLASIHDHAQFLMHFRSPGRNHLMQETFGLMAAAAVIPEFKMSPRWLEVAKLRLDRVLTEEIYPDGGYNELSTFYHRFVIRILQQIADFAEENGVKLSDFFYNRLETMYEFLMYLSWPDGAMPAMNDGFHAKNMRVLYDAPAKTFERADFKFFASEGKEGTEPPQRSIGFPYSGIYVMRSDWSSDARYMIVDAGLFGSSHGHEDKLSFELFAFGKPFIIESGTYTYVYNRWHQYFESSFAHNTIVVDQRSQLRQADEKNWVSSPPRQQPNVWISNHNFDYLESRFDDGYGNRKEDILRGVTHTRRLLFVKPDYWILWDIVDGAGSRTAEQLFHFAVETKVEILDQKNIRVDYAGGSALLISNLTEELALTKMIGEEEPIQGWFSPEYGSKMSAPVVSVESRGELPRVFISVLYPAKRAAQLDSLRIETLPVTIDGKQLDASQAAALKIQFAHSSDYILIAPGLEGEKHFENFRTAAKLFLNRQNVDGSETIEQISDMPDLD